MIFAKVIRPAFLLPLMMLLAMSSCKKNAEPPSKADLLINGKWRLTAYEHHYAGAGYPPDDLYAGLAPCVKDNFYIFYPNNTAELNEGPTKCDPSVPQTQLSNWSLIDQLFIFEWTSWGIQITESEFTIRTKRTSLGGNGYDKTYVKF